jgi:hypothetical protein
LLIFEEYVRPVYNMEVDISRLQGKNCKERAASEFWQMQVSCAVNIP